MRNLDEYHFIDGRDYILLPFCFIIIYIVGIIISKNQKETELKLFKIALIAKLCFGVIYGLVYQYFYKGGDTSFYFINGINILNNPGMSLFKIIKLVFLPFDMTAGIRNTLTNVVPDYVYFSGNFFPVRFTILFGLFTGKTYLNICMLFSAISFIGIWRNYKVFCKIYPALQKQFMWAFLFLPSVIFWASGINKDTLCYGAFTLFTSYFLEIVFLNKKGIKNNILMIIFGALVFVIKPYIIFSFLPIGILIYFRQNIVQKIKSISLRKLFIGTTIIVIAIVFTYNIDWFYNNIYNTVLNNLFFDLLNMNTYLQAFESASNYDIGLSKLDPANINPILFIQKLPICFTTTIFRPFVYEARNPFMLLSSLEGLLTLLLIVFAFFKVNILKFVKNIFSVKIVFLFFIYSVVFSFFIGLTASNFGTLVRYKIPCFSYFIACVFILIYEGKKKSTPIKV